MRTTMMILGMLIGAVGFSQGPPPPFEHRGEMRERMEAQKAAYITDRLDLSPEEAREFWPIYNEFEEKERALREENRPPKKVEDMTEEEAKALIQESMKNEAAIHENRKVYTNRFLEVLSAKKVVLLRRAEMDFRQEVIERIKKRMEGRRKRAN